jgi:AbiU2
VLPALPIDDRIERAAQLVLRARIFFDIWFYFESRDTRPAILDTMQEYSEFFRFAPYAHLIAFVVSIAAVFDKRRGTISLPHLVNEMKRGGLLSTEAQIEVDKLFTQAEPLSSKVAILRHNAFAHRSAAISYDDIFKMAAVTPFEMRELTDVALKLANQLARTRRLAEHSFNELPREDAEAMLRTLTGSR